MDNLRDVLDVPEGRCHVCGYTGPALVRDSYPPICYECQRSAAGRPTQEDHHPLGRFNDPETTFGTLANLHREMDALKARWPDEVRKNVNRDPLMWIAGILLTVRDFAVVIVGYAQQAVDYLLLMRDPLYERHTATWWIDFGLPPIWGAEGTAS